MLFYVDLVIMIDRRCLFYGVIISVDRLRRGLCVRILVFSVRMIFGLVLIRVSGLRGIFILIIIRVFVLRIIAFCTFLEVLYC